MEPNSQFAYRKLVVYQHSRAYVKLVYNFLEFFPQKEEYALCAQLRRASVSIPSNIAEACGRYSKKEQLHFVEIAFGSVYETVCQFEIALDLNYINEEQMKEIDTRAVDITKMLSGWRKTLTDQI